MTKEEFEHYSFSKGTFVKISNEWLPVIGIDFEMNMVMVEGYAIWFDYSDIKGIR